VLHGAPSERAHAVAEHVRAHNHATLPGRSAYRWPSDVDAVIASLQVAVGHLTLALVQASEWLGSELAADRVGHDQGDDSELVVHAAQRWLGAAFSEACELSAALDVVHQYTAGLTGVDVEDVEDGERPCGAAGRRWW